MQPPSPKRDRGAAIAEYAAVIVLVAAIAAVTVTSGFGREIAGNVGAAVGCLVQSSGECESGDAAAPGDPGPDSPAAPDAPVNYGQGPEAPEAYECWAWIQGACDFTQGMWLEGQDMVTGAVEGAQQTACLVHICNPDEFRETWSATGQQAAHVLTDPWGAAQDSWDAATAQIRDDYASGREERSAGRVALIAGSTVFGFLGLGVRALPDPELPTGSVRTHRDAAQREARNGNAAGANRAAENAQRLADASAEQAKKDPTPDNQDQAKQDQADADQARLEAQSAEGFEILLQTESGRELNGLLHRYGTEIDFTNEPGRTGLVLYDPSTDTIVMGSDFLDGDPVQVATRLAHEITHARQNHNGGQPSPYHYGREQYIDAQMKREAEGELAEITVRDELRSDGMNIPETPAETVYRESYDSFIRESEGGPLSEERAAELAEMVALEELTTHLRNQPTSAGDLYEDYYADGWDAANPEGE